MYINEIKQIGKYLNNFDIKIYISNQNPRTTVFKSQECDLEHLLSPPCLALYPSDAFVNAFSLNVYSLL